MLKLVKWAYELGVKQERTRIARELESEMARRAFQRDMQYGMMRDEDLKMGKERRRRLEFVTAVSEEVNGIVGKIFEPQYDDHPRPTIMWPELEDK